MNNSKKLPCGHIFHTVCLRSWFQRQQTCPTCRLNILRTPLTSTQPPQAANNANNNNNGRPEQQQNQPQQPQQPIIAPNPFLNLLNQAAMNNHNQPQSSSGIPHNPFIPSASASGPNMPPPFFLPPFMAPYTIPPPPMPQNLDTLTVEELRAMEGNERNHVEERLKLLKNINTMINASVALMNQYQMVITNLPPIPTVSPQQSSTSTEMPVKSDKDSSPSTSTSNKNEDEKIDNTKVKVEDLGSETHLDQPKTSSSVDSKSSPPTSSIIIDSPSSSSSRFIANETSNTNNGEPDETNEIRKRRLQKFLPN